MTIDEAIKHQRDIAEDYKYQLVLNETGNPIFALGDREIPRIEKNVEEYTQVAEWLEELKTLREYRQQVEWVIKTQRMIRAEAIDEFAIDIINKIDFEDKWLFCCKSNNADTNIAFGALRSFVKERAEQLKE